jgi:hypothetical protein
MSRDVGRMHDDNVYYQSNSRDGVVPKGFSPGLLNISRIVVQLMSPVFAEAFHASGTCHCPVQLFVMVLEVVIPARMLGRINGAIKPEDMRRHSSPLLRFKMPNEPCGVNHQTTSASWPMLTSPRYGICLCPLPLLVVSNSVSRSLDRSSRLSRCRGTRQTKCRSWFMTVFVVPW